LATIRQKQIQVLGMLSLSSGLPLGFVFSTLQIFLRGAGVDLKTIGLLSSVSLPWTLKFLWSPLVDRYALRWPDRRRSWVLLTQAALALGFGVLAAYVARALSVDPATGKQALDTAAAWWIGLIVLGLVVLSATQDIAIDAYAVEFLRKEEHGPASGLRIMYYRIGMVIAGSLAVFLSDFVPWPWVFGGLGLLFVAFMGLTLAADPPERPAQPPRTLGAAVWEPLVGFFNRPQAVVIAAFLVFYKFGDNLGGSMVNAFLKDLCFSNKELGLVVKFLGTAATIAGAGVGAALMTRMGLGRALWIFGFAQAAGNVLYAVTAATHPGAIDIHLCGGEVISGATRLASYVAIAGEYAFQGMGTAALVALVTRLCEKRYSATQYALLSSLFGLGRWLGGPPSGWLAERLGWETFFVVAALAAIPGLALLHLIAPFGKRDVIPGASSEPAA
jgi:PAT family beta-lactamase induction signal transducer AmpG